MNRTGHEAGPIPAEPLAVLAEVLTCQGLTGSLDLPFFVAVGVRWGVFWDPVPPPGTTAREIARRARATVGGPARPPWVQAMLRRWNPDDAQARRAWLESAAFQVVRGPRILPIARHQSRRPEMEVTRALQAGDRYLHARAPDVSAKARHLCLAGVLLALAGVPIAQMVTLDPERGTTPLDDMTHVVRMRLQRAPHPPDEVGDHLLLWEVVRAQDPTTPFPFTRRVPVWLHPTVDGQGDFEVIVEPPGGLGDADRALLDRAVQDRCRAGPVDAPGEGLVVDLPALVGPEGGGDGTASSGLDSHDPKPVTSSGRPQVPTLQQSRDLRGAPDLS
jgi:hypothetical protein